MKKIAIGVGAVVFVVLAIAVLAPVFIDLNDFKPEIAREVEAATGRKLIITGDIDARVLPSPGATVRGIRFANIEGATARDMATLDSIEVDLALGPLLQGNIQVRSVTLVKPVIAIEVLADGRSSLDLAPQGTDSSQNDEINETASASGPAISIDRVKIEMGSISYADARSGETIEIGDIEATLSADSLKGPFAGVGELVVRNVPLSFAISTGSLESGDAIPLSAEIEIASAETKITFRGQASEASADALVKGKLQIGGGDFGRLLASLAEFGGADAGGIPKLAQAYSLSATLDATSRDVALNDFAFELGDSRASGAISAALGDQMRVDVALSVNRFDADGLLVEFNGAPSAADESDASPAATAPQPVAFSLPENLNGSLIVEVEALTFREHVVRRAAIDAAIENGTIRLQRFAAELPGGSDLTIAGTLTTVDRSPRFEGTIRANSDNVRAVLDWIALDTESIAIDRLRRLSLSSGVQITPEVAQVYDIDLTLDSTKIKGGAAYAFRARPSFSVDATIDRLNIDAYLPGVSEPTDAANENEPKDPDAKAASPVGRLAVLDSFDTNFKLAAESLTYSGLAIEGLKLDLSLLAGELTVRELSTTNTAGVAAALSARGRGFSEVPAISTDFNITVADPSRAARRANINQPILARLGALTAKGSLSGSANSLAVDTTLAVDGLRADVSGTVAGTGLGEGDDALAIDLSLNIASPNIAALVGRLDPTVDLGLKGGVEAVGKVKGGLESIDLDLALNAAGAQMTVAGALAPLDGPTYEMQLALSHPNVAQFLDGLGVAYRPAATNLGGISLKSTLQGNVEKVSLGEMDGKFGPARFSGDIDVALGGERPRIDAVVRTSEILLDLFLPRSRPASAGASGNSGGAAGKASSTGERWSRDPIDLSFAQTFDGTIQVSSRGITWGAYSFAEPQLKLAVENGVIDVNPLLGKLFSGDVQLAARVTTTDTPRLGLSLDLKGADLGAAVREAAGIDKLTGAIDLQGRFTALGRNQFEMISTLAGEGSASARDGTVEGIDLRTLSERLKRLNEITDYLSLLQSTMAGGMTQFQSVAGTFAVNRGVVTTTDMRAQLDAAEGSAQATIDLPRWNLDLSSRFRLTEHANAPSIGLDLQGPIDAPRRDVRTRELEQYLTQRAGASILRKALGKDNPLSNILGGSTGSSGSTTTQQPSTGQIPPPPPTGQTQQQPAANPTQQLLKGLGTLLKKN